jgi:hypothetical protein
MPCPDQGRPGGHRRRQAHRYEAPRQGMVASWPSRTPLLARGDAPPAHRSAAPGHAGRDSYRQEHGSWPCRTWFLSSRSTAPGHAGRGSYRTGARLLAMQDVAPAHRSAAPGHAGRGPYRQERGSLAMWTRVLPTGGGFRVHRMRASYPYMTRFLITGGAPCIPQEATPADRTRASPRMTCPVHGVVPFGARCQPLSREPRLTRAPSPSGTSLSSEPRDS